MIYKKEHVLTDSLIHHRRAGTTEAMNTEFVVLVYDVEIH